jgi:hypothetical protein
MMGGEIADSLPVLLGESGGIRAYCVVVQGIRLGPVYDDGGSAKADAGIINSAAAELKRQAEARERKRCHRLAYNFSWRLPKHGDPKINRATDDAACAVAEQIAEAILRAPKAGRPRCSSRTSRTKGLA